MRRLAVLAFVAILSPISACGTGRQQSPKEPSADDQIRAVIHQSIDSWNRGNADAFASTYCAKKRERRVDELMAAGASSEKVEEVTIGRVAVNGDKAEAEVTLTHKDRDADIKTFPMVYEGGQWKTCD